VITVIAGTKGGSSKSTTTCQLAVMRALAGKRTCVYDVDRQQSSALFLRARSGAGREPGIKTVSAAMTVRPGEDPVPLGRALIADIREYASQYEDVIVDCSGEDNPAMRFALLVADQAFAPLAPGMFDRWASNDFSKLVSDVASARTTNFRPRVFQSNVASQMGERQRERWEAVREAYKSFDFLDGVKICNRTAYAESLAGGMGLFEMPRQDPKAKSELLGLYRAVFHEDWMRVWRPTETAEKESA
jgi:chromosome partitioning protein